MYESLSSIISSVCFTGHRNLSEAEIQLLSRRLTILIHTLITDHQTGNFYTGGAIGFDTLAAQVVLDQKTKHENIRLNLILPCEQQDKNWNESQKCVYRSIIEKADSVRILSPFYYNSCMQIRNRELLNASDLCVAYLRDGTSGGGSLNTVLQAAKMNIPIMNLAKPDMEVL